MESGMKNDETIEIHGGRRVHMILLKFFLYSNEVFRLLSSHSVFHIPRKKKMKKKQNHLGSVQSHFSDLHLWRQLS